MRHWTTKYQMRFFIAVLQLSIILCYDTLKILKSGLDRGPIIHYVSYKTNSICEIEQCIEEIIELRDEYFLSKKLKNFLKNLFQ